MQKKRRYYHNTRSNSTEITVNSMSHKNWNIFLNLIAIQSKPPIFWLQIIRQAQMVFDASQQLIKHIKHPELYLIYTINSQSSTQTKKMFIAKNHHTESLVCALIPSSLLWWLARQWWTQLTEIPLRLPVEFKCKIHVRNLHYDYEQL